MIDLSDDPDVTNVLKFLREREIVHFQRFGEALRTVQEKLAQKKFYMNTNDFGTVATTMGGNVIIGENNNDNTNSCGCNTTVDLGNMNTCPNQQNRNNR